MTYLLATLVSFGAYVIVAQYLQLVLGLSALATGFSLVPSAAVVMFVAPYGARAFGRYGARSVTTVAMLIAALCAEGVTEIGNVRQIDRGYERIDERLRDLGARIQRQDDAVPA